MHMQRYKIIRCSDCSLPLNALRRGPLPTPRLTRASLRRFSASSSRRCALSKKEDMPDSRCWEAPFSPFCASLPGAETQCLAPWRFSPWLPASFTVFDCCSPCTCRACNCKVKCDLRHSAQHSEFSKFAADTRKGHKDESTAQHSAV